MIKPSVLNEYIRSTNFWCKRYLSSNEVWHKRFKVMTDHYESCLSHAESALIYKESENDALIQDVERLKSEKSVLESELILTKQALYDREVEIQDLEQRLKANHRHLVELKNELYLKEVQDYINSEVK